MVMVALTGDFVSRYILGNVNVGYIWDSKGGASSSTFGVRPVVSLKLNITPTFVSKDDTTNISTYEI